MSKVKQRGMALVSGLLLLIVVTALGVSMFRSFGEQEKIAGTIREKQRALHAAESAQQYAEWWLSNSRIAAPVVCNTLLDANIVQGQVCTQDLATLLGSVGRVPWQVGGNDVGVSYTPPGMTVSTASAAGTYFARPRFYIGDIGPAASGQGEVYRIDAAGYGGTSAAVAVVESTFSVSVSSWSLE